MLKKSLEKYFSIVFIIFLFSFNSYGAGYIDGRGHFYARNSDQLKFVKDQLLAAAFKDVITKELKTMGLDSEKFWSQYDMKFEKYFEPIIDNLKAKFKIDDPKTNAKKKQQFKDMLRERRLRSKAKFGKLSRVVSSYSIKKVSRSTTMPNSRYMNLSAKINRKLLRNLYFKFTSEGGGRHFKKIFISANFEIEAMTWLDVGVEIENDFTKVIKEHWKNWFLDNLNTYVDEVVITDVVTSEKINAFFKLTEKKPKGVDADVSTDMSEFDEYRDSLWLKISNKIKKIEDDEIMNSRVFEFSGDFILIDLKTNKLVKHYDFVTEKKKVNIENPHTLSSNLASTVYRMPIIEFQNFAKSISSLPSSQSRVGLEVTNVKNIMDVLKLKELLLTKGIAYRFEPELNSYSGQIALMDLSYQGSNDNIVQTLRSLHNQELEPGRVIIIESSDNPFKLTIKENQKVEVNETSS